jgi:aminomethyltransferase
MSDADPDTLQTVPLDARHKALGGRMVPFSGYSLPVQYPSGIVAEHRWTREHAGLFDVSHMGPSFLELAAKTGDTEADHAAVAALIEPLDSGDTAGLKPGQLRYTLLLDSGGGILDDLMIGLPADPESAGSLYIVVNAGTKEDDFARIASAAAERARLVRADAGVLVALQGPEAVEVIAAIAPGAAELGFMHYAPFVWNGSSLIVSRSGYTGEDGFEILADAGTGPALWDALLADARVRPVGLGARDSLRLEAGLPLYGHDLDETVSPIEAGLNFAISKRRREAADYPGAARILDELADGPSRLRIGLRVEGAPAREGAEVLNGSGEVVGRVTSGGFSPSLNAAIAMAYVRPDRGNTEPGNRLQVSVRGRLQPATVTALPFVPHRYVRKAKA